MDRIIYQDTIARLRSATALAYFADLAQTEPVEHAWFEGQYENAVEKENVITYPFDCPAVFYQFSKETEFSGPPNRKKFNGELTLHVVQNKLAIDGVEGMDSHADFKVLLAYAESFIALLDGYRLPCTAYLVLAGVERDHINRGLLVDRIRFTFSGSWNKPSVSEVP